MNTAAAVDAADDSEAPEVLTQNEAAAAAAAGADESGQPHSNDAVATEVSFGYKVSCIKMLLEALVFTDLCF